MKKSLKTRIGELETSVDNHKKDSLMGDQLKKRFVKREFEKFISEIKGKKFSLDINEEDLKRIQIICGSDYQTSEDTILCLLTGADERQKYFPES